MKTPSAFDKIIIRVLATEQWWVSLAGFPLVLMAMNSGGASVAANAEVLPLLLMYLFYGLVTAVFLYSAVTPARVLVLVWHAVFLWDAQLRQEHPR